MSSIRKLPDSELDIMLILWQYERPVKIIEIYEGLKSVRPCTKSAIHTLIDHLDKKGFIKIEFSEDKQSHKLITPLVSEDDYRRAQASSFVDKLCGGHWQKLICALIDSNKISDDDLDEIASLLEKKGK